MFGLGLGLNKIIQKNNRLDPDAKAFYNRVIADDGTFEAMPCLLANIAFLKGIDIDYTPMEFLQYRAGLEGATFEAFTCGNTIIENLQNIEI